MSEAKKDPVNRSKMPLNTGSFASLRMTWLIFGILRFVPNDRKDKKVQNFSSNL